MTMSHKEAWIYIQERAGMPTDRSASFAAELHVLQMYLEARGLVMVPKEPTFEMAKAAIHLDPKSDLDAKYRAMLAAAPDPFGGE